MDKTFDAVAESRKWRTTTGKKLSAMSGEERLAYLNLGKLKQKIEQLTDKGQAELLAYLSEQMESKERGGHQV